MTSSKKEIITTIEYMHVTCRVIVLYRIAFDWFYYRHVRTLDSSIESNVKKLLVKLHKQLRKLERKERSDITLQKEIQKRKFPPQGLNQLQMPVEEGLQWARELTSEDFQDENTFREFVRHFYSSLYTHNPTGKTRKYAYT
jgi:hypothetical protein